MTAKAEESSEGRFSGKQKFLPCTVVISLFEAECFLKLIAGDLPE